MAEEVRLYFLGAPRIEREGQAVEVDTRKALALAAYLALSTGMHRREALAVLLWPDYDPERAFGNLRRTLWSLRQAVGEEWLDAGQDTIGLAPRPGLWVDVLEFRRHLESRLAHGHGEGQVCAECIPALEAAIALYHDDFLAGFSLRDAPAFDDWQLFQAEALRLELADALAAATLACIEAEDLARAVEHARRRVALDPLNEAAHRQLMIVYATMGDRGAALRQYEVCVRSLRDELGAEPGAEVELLLADILATAPSIKLLVTSRERLNLQGEWVFQVAGMAVPAARLLDDPAGCEPASIEQYGAARLFLERAHQANAHFSWQPAEACHLARICHLVDGLPLGLELAATWTRVLPLSDIVGEIERSLDFLATRDRDRPDRQRSQRAVFDHSWRLLSPTEQAVFARLSAFQGGFDRSAALQVAGASLPSLSALVDKSLLYALPLGRYVMHELMRQYAAEKLAAHPADAARTQEAHAAYYLGWLHDQESLLKGAGHTAAAEAIAAEIENVRAAWQRALSLGRWTDVRRAAWSLATFYDVRSRFEEGYAAFYDAVSVLETGGDVATRAVALAFLSRCATRLYRVQESVSLGRRALALIPDLGPDPDRALVLLVGAATEAAPDHAAGEAMLHEALDIYREHRDLWGVALCLMTLGDVSRFAHGDVALGRGYMEASYRVSRQAKDPVNLGHSVFAMGELAQAAGDRQEAIRLYGESLGIRRALCDGWGIAYCLDCMGYLARELGELDEAYRLHEESMVVSREIGDQLGVAGSFDNLGLLARDRGQLAKAQALFEQALELRRAIGRPGDVAVSLRHVARLALDRGDAEAAARDFRQAIALAQQIDWKWEIAESELGLAESMLALGDGDAARHHLVAAMRTTFDMEEWALAAEILVVAAPLLLAEGEPRLAAAALECVIAARASRHTTRVRARRLLGEIAHELPGASAVESVEATTRRALEHFEHHGRS